MQMTGEPRSSETNEQAGGVAIGDIDGGIRDAVIAGRDVTIGQRITQFFGFGPNEQRAQRNRRAMLELVRNTWIKGVLEQSLHGAAMIELGLEERADAVERPWDMVLQTPDQPNRPLPHGTKIASVFDEMSGALLILGEPGSGKTTMLLELARDTIARAEEDLIQPIPVVFNLSSWADRRQSIAEWLVDELNTKYNIPKRIARSWVENDDLLLLLDGLDEVKREHRDACVEAINGFRQEHMMPLAICSRIADYEALTTRLELQGAVLLLPLTPQQVEQYLEGAGTELLAVRKTLQHDPTLQELAQSPLMLSVMTLAYQGTSVEDLGSLDLIETRRRHVFDAYVQRMFERRSIDQPHSPEQTIYWLAWLAQKIVQHSQAVFLIEQMQPGWLQTDGKRRFHTILNFVISGLIGGSIVGLTWGLIGGLTLGLRFGFIPALIVGSIWGLFGGLAGGLFVGPSGRLSDKLAIIEPIEVLTWSWKGVEALLSGLTGGLIGGLICGLSFGLGGGLIGSLAFGLLTAFLRGLLAELSHTEVRTRTEVNQGIRWSARNGIRIGLIIWLSFGLSLGLVFGLRFGPAGGLICGPSLGLCLGLIWGMTWGGFACIQHFTLRLILYQSGRTPWNYIRFLDYAAERIFLRKVGGGYIFVHRLLMEHFVAMSTEKAA